MDNWNFFNFETLFLSKSCYENNYMGIDQNKINSILATTDNYKLFSHDIKPTHTGYLLIDTHNMTHLSDFPNFSKFRPNSIMLA